MKNLTVLLIILVIINLSLIGYIFRIRHEIALTTQSAYFNEIIGYNENDEIDLLNDFIFEHTPQIVTRKYVKKITKL